MGDMALAALVLAPLALIWLTLAWAPAGLSCVNRAPPGSFAAFCIHDDFGDYEHGAFYFGLEPHAIESARAAEVVFLGNSRGQFAFSTDSTKEFFTARAVRYHLLGFAYDERSEFALKIMLRNGISPRVVVINADPFFSRHPSEIAKVVEAAGLSTWLEYTRKKLVHMAAGPLCSKAAWLCKPASPVAYRDASTGAWHWQGFYGSERSVPVPPSRAAMVGRGMEHAMDEGSEFIRRMGIVPECIVLTAVPQTFDDPGSFVRRLAQHLGATVILPSLDGLATFDAAHLNRLSAERWSRAFLSELEPVLGRCLSI